MNTPRLRVCASQKFIDEGNKVNLCASLGDTNDALPRLGLDCDEEVDRSVAAVLIVLFARGALALWAMAGDCAR